MKADFAYDVLDPTLVMNAQKTSILIRCEIFDQRPEGHRRSGKHVHLTMTTGEAMRLLAQLQAAQKISGVAAPSASATQVPPTKDRN